MNSPYCRNGGVGLSRHVGTRVWECELYWGHGQCRIVLPTEEAWSASSTRGARTPFLNATFTNSGARARVRHATSQEAMPRTVSAFSRLFRRGTRMITHCDACYC